MEAANETNAAVTVSTTGMQIYPLSVVMLDHSYIPELTEDNIPGASLSGRNPSELHLQELKHWLKCRGANLLLFVCYITPFYL